MGQTMKAPVDKAEQKFRYPKPKVGEKVWRPVNFVKDVSMRIVKHVVKTAKIQEVTFSKSEKGDTVVKIFYNGGGWSVSKTEKGFVCFCKEPIPANWTHFEITGIAKTGKFCFVKPVAGPEKELLEMYE